METEYKNAVGEYDIDPEDPCYEAVMKERRRCQAVLAVHEQWFKDDHWPTVAGGPAGEMLLSRLLNLIHSGRDFERPDDGEDRLPGL